MFTAAPRNCCRIYVDWKYCLQDTNNHHMWQNIRDASQRTNRNTSVTYYLNMLLPRLQLLYMSVFFLHTCLMRSSIGADRTWKLTGAVLVTVSLLVHIAHVDPVVGRRSLPLLVPLSHSPDWVAILEDISQSNVNSLIQSRAAAPLESSVADCM